MGSNILIVDDHKLFGEGLASLIGTEKENIVVGIITRGAEVMQYIEKLSVDIVFMDVELPDANGLDLAKKIKLRYPSVAVITLTMHNSPEILKEVVEIGIAGYMVKSSGKDEILQAIKIVTSGQKYYSPEVINNMISSSVSESNTHGKVIITQREREVLKLVVQGKSTNEISEQLFISKHTVDTHRKNLLSKLNVKNTAELVQIAINEKLI